MVGQDVAQPLHEAIEPRERARQIRADPVEIDIPVGDLLRCLHRRLPVVVRIGVRCPGLVPPGFLRLRFRCLPILWLPSLRAVVHAALDERAEPRAGNRTDRALEVFVECSHDLAHRRVAVRALLAHAAVHDRFQVAVQIGPERAQERRVLVQDGVQHLDDMVAGKRPAAGQDREQRRAQGIHV